MHEPHVYNAGFVKLREVSIGYVVPQKLTEKLKIRQLSVALVARNVWVIHKATPNIDPEAAYNNGNGQGIEYGTYPVNRTVGLNLKVTL